MTRTLSARRVLEDSGLTLPVHRRSLAAVGTGRTRSRPTIAAQLPGGFLLRGYAPSVSYVCRPAFARPTFLLLAAIAVLTCGPIAECRVKTGQKPKPKQPAKGPVLTFDPTIERLPAGYRGEDVTGFLGRAAIVLRAKDEFEKTDEYIDSMAASLPSSVSSHMLLPSVGGITYDADSENLTAVLPASGLAPGSCTSLAGGSLPSGGVGFATPFLVSSNRASTGKAPNGRTVRIRVVSKTRLGLRLDERRDPRSSGGSSLASFAGTLIQMQMPPSEARNVKPHLRLLLVGRFAVYDPSSLVCVETSTEPATLTDRVAVTWTTVWVTFRLDEVWLYNFRTGAVLRKYSPIRGAYDPVGMTPKRSPEPDGTAPGTAFPDSPGQVEVEQLIETAEGHFRKGKDLFNSGDRSAAREEFNAAIDTILQSGVDYRANLRLDDYLQDLLEAIQVLDPSIFPALEPTSPPEP